MALFKHGDLVNYIGTNTAHKAALGGAVGTVLSQVKNCDVELVVDFGEDAWVMHESLLCKFAGYKDKGDKPEKHGKEKPKTNLPEVVLRRGRKSEEDTE
jgi:hypothetical protein